MKRLILVISLAIVGVIYGIRAVDTVQASISQRAKVISETFRK